MKIIRTYENIHSFNGFEDYGKLIRVTYKDATKPTDLFFSTGRFSMGPREALVNYYKLLGISFKTIEDALNFRNQNDRFSVNAFDAIKFEILDIE
jgi:hypothetical protein